ncbi:MAG TPA: anhydro-N-acetylmuramic acid kinase [Burkholderiaceae bacterium]|nr:anhydro-N-acetylmuramic acid kinase [Burkholderiaceae bacterium]
MSQADSPHLYVGIMSGTSLDGVDVVLADLSEGRVRLLAHLRRDFAPELRAVLAALQTSGKDELHRAAIASQHLGRTYAIAIGELLHHAGVEPEQVRAAGIHGQTVRHQPEAGYTIQLNAPATVAELTGIDVIADFRSRDVAAGGQGAPLVPAFHAAVFSASYARAVVNIGGIANLTGLPAASSDAPVIGFDCGPGNALLDLWIARHRGERFDRDGEWAAQGNSQPGLLSALLDEPYFLREPPKTTGANLFNAQWLERKLEHFDPAGSIHPRDVQASLARFTAVTIAQAMQRCWPQAQEVVVCGGGAFNACLMRMLAEECAPVPVTSSASLGIAPDHVESLAFAWLAREHILGRSGNLTAVTGARAPRILGARYPK